MLDLEALKSDPVQGRIERSLRHRFAAQPPPSDLPIAKATLRALLGERTRKQVHLAELVALCEALQVSLRDVLAGEVAWGPWDPKETAPRVARRLQRNLRQARERSGKTQVEVAELAAVDQSFVSRFEAGEYERTDLVRVERMAWACDTQLSDLLT